MEPAGKQEKTKYKLAASMKECMKQMPVDKITVKNMPFRRIFLKNMTFMCIFPKAQYLKTDRRQE